MIFSKWARAISKILFILGSYNFLAYLEYVRSYAWSKGHSDLDLGSVQCLYSVVVSTLAFYPGDLGSISCLDQQIFKISFSASHPSGVIKPPSLKLATSGVTTRASFNGSEGRVISHIKGLP